MDVEFACEYVALNLLIFAIDQGGPCPRFLLFKGFHFQ